MVMIPFNGISIMVYFFKDNFGKDVSKQALLTKLPVSLLFFFCLLFFTFVVFICCICCNFYHHVMFNISYVFISDVSDEDVHGLLFRWQSMCYLCKCI